MFFTYKATNSAGKMTEGTQEATSKEELYRNLKGEGLVLVEAHESSGGDGTLGIIKSIDQRIKEFTGRVKEEEKITFARGLGSMVRAGLPLSRALSVTKRQSKNITFKKMVTDLQDSIRTGSSLGDALDEHSDIFSDLFIAMVRAGEESGNMASTLTDLADRMERSYKLRKKIKGALIYPAVIIVAMIAIAILMLIFVVPTLASTFIDLGVELPMSTQMVITISEFLSNHTLVALLLIVLMAGVIVGFLRTPRGTRGAQWLLLRTPVIGNLIKEVNAARTAATLSSLLSSGVEIVHAVSITRSVVQNVWYRDVLDEMEEVIQKGENMSEVFTRHEDLYPAFIGEMTLVGEETGELSSLLAEVSNYYEDDVQQKTQDLSTIIEPVLMIIIGVAVGFFAISMITPMYSLTSAI